MSIYSDLNSYDPYNQPLLYDSAAISQSLDNIISTLTMTRLFLPDFPGENLDERVFDSIDKINSVEVYRVVSTLVTRWEKRVKILNSLSKVVPVPSKHRYDIDLVYLIQGFGNQQFRLKGSLKR